jgi:hypothetical protein
MCFASVGPQPMHWSMPMHRGMDGLSGCPVAWSIACTTMLLGHGGPGGLLGASTTH